MAVLEAQKKQRYKYGGCRASRNPHSLPRLVVLVAGFLQMLCFLSLRVSGIGNSNQHVPNFPLEGIGPDPFVEMSPLVIGVVCSDGVLLLALHSVFSEDNDESSLLLSSEEYSNPRGGQYKNPCTTFSQEVFDQQPPVDLPESFRGPFRIHSLAEKTAMVCAGWRTDGTFLVDHLRSMEQTESAVFGNTNQILVDRASLFLARSMVSQGKRPLSCASLLASDSNLWVVDATGAYAARAHALGSGSQIFNKILRSNPDWSRKESHRVAKHLLEILFSEEALAVSRFDSKTPVEDKSCLDSDCYSSECDIKKLSTGCRVEIAVVESKQYTKQEQKQKQKQKEQRSSVKRLFASKLSW